MSSLLSWTIIDPFSSLVYHTPGPCLTKSEILFRVQIVAVLEKKITSWINNETPHGMIFYMIITIDIEGTISILITPKVLGL